MGGKSKKPGGGAQGSPEEGAHGEPWDSPTRGPGVSCSCGSALSYHTKRLPSMTSSEGFEGTKNGKALFLAPGSVF